MPVVQLNYDLCTCVLTLAIPLPFLEPGLQGNLSVNAETGLFLRRSPGGEPQAAEGDRLQRGGCGNLLEVMP